ncbi:MAG: hypothetical protein JNJ54_29495 [Myxococcaceae bacterium]|nr:hypothetical protein [Myxococcaceae bacterium]
MALTSGQLEQRRPLWSAMSDLFLDTETRWSVPYVGWRCAESGLDDATLDAIFWCEVFPLAIFNLHDIAGEWAMLTLPESQLVARAERQERDRVQELTSAWMVKHTWDAALVVCRRLRTEPSARWRALMETWEVLGKRFLEDVGRKLISAPQPILAKARGAGVDVAAEWRFYEPVLHQLAGDDELKTLDARLGEVRAMLAASEG